MELINLFLIDDDKGYTIVEFTQFKCSDSFNIP